jgi:hypothetical protein
VLFHLPLQTVNITSESLRPQLIQPSPKGSPFSSDRSLSIGSILVIRYSYSMYGNVCASVCNWQATQPSPQAYERHTCISGVYRSVTWRYELVAITPKKNILHVKSTRGVCGQLWREVEELYLETMMKL